MPVACASSRGAPLTSESRRSCALAARPAATASRSFCRAASLLSRRSRSSCDTGAVHAGKGRVSLGRDVGDVQVGCRRRTSVDNAAILSGTTATLEQGKPCAGTALREDAAHCENRAREPRAKSHATEADVRAEARSAFEITHLRR